MRQRMMNCRSERKPFKMNGHKKYELNDPNEIRRLNDLLKPSGISVQTNLLDVYIMVDMDRYTLFTKRRAGRRTVITDSLRRRVYALKAENRGIRDISRQTGVSPSTVGRILEDWEAPEETDQLSLDI
jgi:hypothetical protein